MSGWWVAAQATDSSTARRSENTSQRGSSRAERTSPGLRSPPSRPSRSAPSTEVASGARGFGSGLVLQQRTDLLAEFRSLCVPVNRFGVEHRQVQHFLFGSGDRQGAVLFAGKEPAVDDFSLWGRHGHSSMDVVGGQG